MKEMDEKAESRKRAGWAVPASHQMRLQTSAPQAKLQRSWRTEGLLVTRARKRFCKQYPRVQATASIW